MAQLARFTFGATSAIVTSTGMIVGLHAAGASRATIVSGLLVLAVADNLSDSLSIHIYQESEHTEARAAFRATVTNYVARFTVSCTFVGWTWVLPAAGCSTATSTITSRPA